MTIPELLGHIFGPYGTLFIVLVIIYTGHKKIWVWGWYAKELVDRNNTLENKIDTITGTARSIASTAEKIADKQTEATSA